MKKTTRINLHCHSDLSDGELSPEGLAVRLAAEGVEYAGLTDHDTIDGVPRFREALKRRNVGFLTGVEITSQRQGREIHLLAYGFDPDNPELITTLRFLRHKRISRIQGALRQLPSQLPPELEGEPAPGVAATGQIDIVQAIALVHRAGGLAFFAHPLNFESNPDVLDGLVGELKAAGLDGIEVICGQTPESDRQTLEEMARRHDLLISAGTDFHGAGGPYAMSFGIDFPTEHWKRFARELSTGQSPNAPLKASSKGVCGPEEESRGWSNFRPRIVLPSLLVIVLFVTTIWGMILPSIESLLIDRKRETIRELTNTALSLLAAAEREERAGLISRAEAQEKAKAYIGALRYGKEGKDYFWIQDLHPRMIMHPYRSDLNGKDVSGVTDPRGVHIFVRFAQIVRQQEKGFVEYVWQWKDDPDRLAAKESYVSGFAPWGWIIGTGIYIDDVMHEIKRIEKNTVYILMAIVALVSFVLIYNVRQSLGIEKKRRDMQESLREAEERYRSLIEAATEGTLLVVSGRCRYGNPTLLKMTGYTPDRLELMALSDLLPRNSQNREVWNHVERLSDGVSGTMSCEAVLERSDGETRDVVITLNPIVFGEQKGIIVLVKDVYPSRMDSGSVQQLGRAAQSAAIGLFQAKAVRTGDILVMNAAAQRLFQEVRASRDASFALADLFDDGGEYDRIFNALRRTGSISDHTVEKAAVDGRTRVFSLSAVRVAGERGEPPMINGLIQDITEAVQRETEREAFIEKLGISLLFLQEPVGKLGSQPVTCPLETPIHKAASLMIARDSTCVVVETDAGAPVGLVSDHDFRKRVVISSEADLRAPVRTIMSAPLITISEKAMIYEALMLMEEKKVQHLAVMDSSGRIGSVVRAMELLKFHRYGPAVLLREIASANDDVGVVRSCERLPSLVKALVDAGARPRIVAHMTSAVCDAATSRFIELAIEELGPPPAPFVFIAMGSQGRQEQTLLTDQDNAIIYEVPDAPEAGITATGGQGMPASADKALNRKAVSEYFLSLGKKVCQWLDQSGYALCSGDVMAGNPKWCLSLPEWKENFADWILKAEPGELLDISICLDFRSVYGKAELVHELRGFVYEALKDRPSFLPHLAQNALHFKPPFRLLGKIIKSGGPPEEAGQLNLKETLMPLVGFGRLFALRHHMPHTHTMERIEALVWKGVLDSSTCDAVSASYDILMRLRFKAQLSKLREGRQLDNCVRLNKIAHMDEAMLKQAFMQIESLQKKIVHDFLGGPGGV